MAVGLLQAIDQAKRTGIQMRNRSGCEATNEKDFRGLLSTHCERPRPHRAAHERDEIAAFHSSPHGQAVGE